ncbi:MAG: hypothetical protein LBH00_11350, partial [Planctomycetaceae bacterium]|nr:hypothetical protein [Planctomycetaceae bacterium]
SDPDVKYFSGIAVYTNEAEMNVADNERLFLELEGVREFAEVKINGKSAGTIWAAPYRLDITSLWKEGKNRIEIEVANHWSNRIIGDASLPEDKRTTRTNITKLTAKTPLTESGITGTVRLRAGK